MQISYLNSDLCFSCSYLLKKAKTATIVANIQILWKLFILQAMHNYQRTSTSMFIGHFALTPEPLVRLSWNFVLRILHTMCMSGANFSPIWPKKCWSSGGLSFLQMTICKGTDEHGGGQIIQMVSCNNPCSSIPLIMVIWRTVLFANYYFQGSWGGRIFRMIICNNSCSSVPLILVIRRTTMLIFSKEKGLLIFLFLLQ